MDDRIREFFTTHQNELAADIAALVSIPSVREDARCDAPYGRAAREALDVAVGMAESFGLDANVIDDRVTLIELGDGKPQLGILAHLDVVPPAGKWTKTEPFTMTLENGILYGRGVADDKGPAVAALYALRAIHALNIPLKRKVQLILGSAEETGSEDIAWYRKNHELPPMLFTPDASFPVVNLEKGHLNMLISAPYDREGSVLSISGGTVPNAVPAECKAVVARLDMEAVKAAFSNIAAKFDFETVGDGNIKITCTGTASHASIPEEGVNAVCAMLEGLSRLPIEGERVHDTIKKLANAIPFGDTSGRACGAFREDEESGALTMNLGVLDYSAESGLSVKVDCRIPICADGHVVAAKLRCALGKGLTLKITGLTPPHNTPSDSKFVKTLLKIYNDFTGQQGKALAIGGGTYVHGIKGAVAFGCEFPGGSYHMHEPDERMPLEELLLSGQMFTRAILEFCGG